MSRFQWICGVWIVLFFLFLPFPLDYMPEPGIFLTQLLLPVTKAVSSVPDEILANTSGFSDSIHLYVQSAVLLVLAIPLGTILSKRKYDREILAIINAIIAAILGFFLLKYGIEKLTRLQFPQPPPNILFTPAGQLDKDILFWSLMGTSKAYAWFMGITEIAAGILVLIRKTRAVGALISVGIFANILALNIGFDITVKLLAFVLLAGAVYLLSPYVSNLIAALTNKEFREIQVAEATKIPGIWKRSLKGIAIALIAFECILPVLNRLENPEYTSELTGTYEATVIQDTLPGSGFPAVKRLHFHPHGFLISEYSNGHLSSQAITISNNNGRFSFRLGTNTAIFSNQGDRWYLEWMHDPKSRMIFEKKNNAALPLLQDEFHWTVEGMIETEPSEE